MRTTIEPVDSPYWVHPVQPVYGSNLRGYEDDIQEIMSHYNVDRATAEKAYEQGVYIPGKTSGIGQGYSIRPYNAKLSGMGGFLDWARRNWSAIISVIGLLFVAVGVTGEILRRRTREAKAALDEIVPPEEKMSQPEFEELTDMVHTWAQGEGSPMSKSEVRSILYDIVGERVTNGERLPAMEKTGLPTWAWLAMAGGAGYLLLRSKG